MASSCLGYSRGRTNSIRRGAEGERRWLVWVGMVEHNGDLHGRGDGRIGIVATPVVLRVSPLEPPRRGGPLAVLGSFGDVRNVPDDGLRLGFFHEIPKIPESTQPVTEGVFADARVLGSVQARVTGAQSVEQPLLAFRRSLCRPADHSHAPSDAPRRRNRRG